MNLEQKPAEVSTLWSDPKEPTLAVRLSSPMTRGGRWVGTFILAALFGGLTYVFYAFPPPEEIAKIIWVAATGVFGLLAVLLIWSALMQTFALIVPETIFEVEKQIVQPGETIQFCVKQLGPVHLNSLRANLIGLQRTERKHRDPRKPGTDRAPDSMHYHENILDSDGAWLYPGQTQQWISQLTIPEDAIESGKAGSRVTKWSIEVWGRAFFFVGFMRSFTIQVGHSE